MGEGNDGVSPTTTEQCDINPVTDKGQRAVDYRVPKGLLNTPPERAYGIGGWKPSVFDDNNVYVVTRFNEMVIEQQTFMGAGVDIRQEFTKRVLDLQEQGVRDALIKLGWTPPPGE